MGYSIIDLRPVLDPMVVTTDKHNRLNREGFSPGAEIWATNFPMSPREHQGRGKHMSITNHDNVLN